MYRSRQLIIVLLLVVISITSSAQEIKPVQPLEKYIEEAVEKFGLSGLSVAIVKNDSVIFSRGFGYADVKKKVPMRSDALFNIASCSKAFTAACVALLVEQKKINWEDPVIKYVPEFRLSDPWVTSKLNIIDILSHRSGLATFDGDLLWYATDYTDREILARLAEIPLRNNFRSDYGYQNTMFILAGELIKQVSGMSYSQFVYENLFRPLDMISSRTCSKDLSKDQFVASPHLKRIPQRLTMEKPNAAGSIYSSCDELSNWMIMLLNGGRWNKTRILSASSIENLFSAKTVLDVSPFYKANGIHFRAYGMGWFLMDYAGRKIVEHGGGMPGYISKVTLVPEEKFGLVLLSNDMNSLVEALRFKILDYFFKETGTDWAELFLTYTKSAEEREKAAEENRKSKRILKSRPSLPLDNYQGLYRDQMYGDAEVVLEGKALRLTLLPTNELFTGDLQHWHYDTFRIELEDAFLPTGFVTFEFDSWGSVTGFKIDLPNPDFHFKNLHFIKIEKK